MVLQRDHTGRELLTHGWAELSHGDAGNVARLDSGLRATGECQAC